MSDSCQPPLSDRNHFSETATRDKLETRKITSDLSQINSSQSRTRRMMSFNFQTPSNMDRFSINSINLNKSLISDTQGTKMVKAKPPSMLTRKKFVTADKFSIRDMLSSTK